MAYAFADTHIVSVSERMCEAFQISFYSKHQIIFDVHYEYTYNFLDEYHDSVISEISELSKNEKDTSKDHRLSPYHINCLHILRHFLRKNQQIEDVQSCQEGYGIAPNFYLPKKATDT